MRPSFGTCLVSPPNPHSPSHSVVTVMDLINECLSLSPPPYLAPALSAFKFIWLDVRAAQVSQRQLEALARSVAQLLVTLDRECRAGRQLQIGAGTPLTNLCRFVRFVKFHIFIHTPILQAVGGYLGIRSKSGIKSVFETSLYQGSKECSDRSLLPIND